MIATSVPPEARAIADLIKGVFPGTNYAYLCATICYFMLGKKNVCEAVRDLAFAPSVSTMTEQMKSMNPSRMMRRMRKSVMLKFDINPEEWVYVLDDTSNPRYGKFFRAGYWGSSGGVYHGQKVMVLALVNLKTKRSIPIDFILVPKRLNKQSTKMPRYAWMLLNRTLKAGFPKLTVVADSWFDGAAFVKSVERLGLTFVFQLKSNRRVKANPGPYCSWKRLPEVFRDAQKRRTKTEWDSHRVKRGFKRGKSIAELWLQVKNRSKSLKVIGVYDRRNSKRAFGYYASTDQTVSRARMWMISRARWSIEVIFRCCKQHLSFGQLSCVGKNAAHLSVAMPFYLFYKLSDECPDGISLDRFLGQLRERSFGKALDTIIRLPDSERVEVLRNRRSPERVHRKPVSSSCGRKKEAA